MKKLIRIGTRDSQLAVWQATQVMEALTLQGLRAELVFIKSEGDLDLITPLYAMGVQGIFTRALDAALLNEQIDLAVHSMKDVPTQLAKGLVQAAVLKRASAKDILVYSGEPADIYQALEPRPASRSQAGLPAFTIATSSVRRKAQWLHRYPHHTITGLRGNVNTRLEKLLTLGWQGAVFAAAGLERINLRPANSIDLDWMLPAPAQGAVLVLARLGDELSREACLSIHDEDTALCTAIERDFLGTLLGGCSTPISALAEIEEGEVYFRGNVLLPDGSKQATVESILPLDKAYNLGEDAAATLLANGGSEILDRLFNDIK